MGVAEEDGWFGFFVFFFFFLTIVRRPFKILFYFDKISCF